MKHEVKDEKAGSGFVNDVEKGDDFVATDAVDEANDEEGKLTFTRLSGFKGAGACLKVILLTTGLCKTKWFQRRTLLMIIKCPWRRALAVVTNLLSRVNVSLFSE
ncbi:hypothetical protein Peur_004322 [Populus x canadensis]